MNTIRHLLLLSLIAACVIGCAKEIPMNHPPVTQDKSSLEDLNERVFRQILSREAVQRTGVGYSKDQPAQAKQAAIVDAIVEIASYIGGMNVQADIDDRDSSVDADTIARGFKIYGFAVVKESFSQSETVGGMVSYARSVEEAKSEMADLIGSSPLVVKAIGVRGRNKTHVVVGDTTAVIIFAADVRDDFLRFGKVIFVID